MAPGDLITKDGQVEFNGLLMGAGTPYGWVQLTGWRDLPGLRSYNVERPSRHGSFAGLLLASERVITLSYKIAAATTDVHSALLALEAVTDTQIGVTEYPLVVQINGQKLLTYARCTQRAIPLDKNYSIGYAEGALQFVSSDPRRYSVTESVLSTGLPVVTGGLTFPITAPFVFNSTGTGGSVTITNLGSIPAPVTITFYADLGLTNPSVQLASTGQKLAMTYVMSASDSLKLVTDTHEVTLNGSVSRRAFLTTDQWFDLQPGNNTLLFAADSSSGSPTMEVRWRSTWL